MVDMPVLYTLMILRALLLFQLEIQPSPLLDSQIDLAIRDLGHPEFKRRESAGKQLRDMGDKALPLLRQAEKSAPDPEIRKRARETRRRIEERWLVKRIQGPRVAASQMAISPAGDRVLSYSGEATAREPLPVDNSLRVWSLSTGKDLHKHVLTGYIPMILDASITGDGKQALTFRRNYPVPPTKIAQFPDNRDGYRKISFWDLDSGNETAVYKGNSPAPRAPARLSDDRSRILTAAMKNRVLCMDAKTSREIASLSLVDPYCAVFLPGNTQALCSSNGAPVRLWDIPTGKIVRTYDVTMANYRLVVSGDGSKFLASCEYLTTLQHEARRRKGVPPDFSCKVVDVRSGRLLGNLVGHEAFTELVAFSPNDKFALTASRDGVAILWDLATMKEARRFEQNKPWPRAISFTPDNKYALVGNTDNSICMYALPSSP